MEDAFEKMFGFATAFNPIEVAMGAITNNIKLATTQQTVALMDTLLTYLNNRPEMIEKIGSKVNEILLRINSVVFVLTNFDASLQRFADKIGGLFS